MDIKTQQEIVGILKLSRLNKTPEVLNMGITIGFDYEAARLKIIEELSPKTIDGVTVPYKIEVIGRRWFQKSWRFTKYGKQENTNCWRGIGAQE
jgi:hypothetical protein